MRRPAGNNIFQKDGDVIMAIHIRRFCGACRAQPRHDQGRVFSSPREFRKNLLGKSGRSSILMEVRLNLNNEMQVDTQVSEKCIALLSLKAGDRGRVLQIDAEASLQRRLQELGLVAGAEISVLRINGSVLCQISSSRFGIDRAIAERVKVVPV